MLFQNWILCAAALSMGMLGDTKAQAQSAVEAWVQRYNGPTESNDRARKVAVDSSGNVIVAGYSSGITFDDWLIIKYSSAGVPLWANRYDGPGNDNDLARAVAVDHSGNVFVTGESTGSGSSADYTTIKYSSAGVPLWTNRYNGSGNFNDVPRAVAVDGSGNVFVTGYSYGSGSSFDYTTIAYSNAGVGLWTNRYNGPGNDVDIAKDVACRCGPIVTTHLGITTTSPTLRQWTGAATFS